METTVKINEAKIEKDYFPSIFINRDKSIIVLASERTGEKTFAGTVIHSSNKTSKGNIGMYSTSWTYEQFKRLPKGSSVNIEIQQTD